jgi:4-hydroxy-3-polyprenylbenzoate decarboxylase
MANLAKRKDLCMRIIVGVSGASGAVLGKNMLAALKQHPQVETHLVMSEGSKLTEKLELNSSGDELSSLADFTHPIDDIAANIASGSFQTAGMIIIPCSMKTLAGIANGYSDNLLLRAADVCLKERRKVILVAREMPFSNLHLKNMLTVSEYGALIMPPMLTFYNSPETIDDMINHLIGKIMMQFDLDFENFRPWKGG